MSPLSLLYEIFNGDLVVRGMPLFNSDNRAIRYGDGLFETIHVRSRVPMYLADHWERLNSGMKVLGISTPENFNQSRLETSIQSLLLKNNLENARVRLVLFREAEGFYKPVGGGSSWHLSISGAVESQYKTSVSGLSADVFEDDYKSCGVLSNLKSLNALIYVCSGMAAQRRGFDDLLIKNNKGNLIESGNSNLFLRKGTQLITPPLSEGCLNGVMRKQVIALLKKHQLSLSELPIQLNDVMEADEIILTNVIRGAGWIGSFRGKSYGNEYCTSINKWLNEAFQSR